MNPQRDSNLLSRGLLIGGAVLILVAVMVFASRPASIAMGEPAWFDTESTRGDRSFLAFALGGLGVFTSFAGLMFSQRARALRHQIVSDTAGAVAQGITGALGSGPINFTGGRVGPSPSARLADLDDLRRRGLVTDHEYQVKRNQILAAL